MPNRIFIEENQKYQIDFTRAQWATDQLRDIYFNQSKIHLPDVDFIAETEDKLLLVEYKNGNIKEASRSSFNPIDDKNIQKVADKFYDSLVYVNGLGKDKPVEYIYIVEYPNADIVSTQYLRTRIQKELPFLLQERAEIIVPIINGFEVFSIDEWNAHNEYYQYPLTPVENRI